jgi:hypothetical protein
VVYYPKNGASILVALDSPLFACEVSVSSDDLITVLMIDPDYPGTSRMDMAKLSWTASGASEHRSLVSGTTSAVHVSISE